MVGGGGRWPVLPIPYFVPVVSPVQEFPSNENIQNEVPNNTCPQSQPHVITYQPKTRVVDPPLHEESSNLCLTSYCNNTTDLLDNNSNWSTAIRKGIRCARNPHPIYNFLSYHHLSPSYFSRVLYIFYCYS